MSLHSYFCSLINKVFLIIQRRKIIANDNLSVNGKNMRIIVDNSVVTLRGLVKSKEEKDWIENATKSVTFNYTLDSQLEVAPK